MKLCCESFDHGLLDLPALKCEIDVHGLKYLVWQWRCESWSNMVKMVGHGIFTWCYGIQQIIGVH
jgi:hypothetical protein